MQKAYITLRLKEIRDKIISTEKIEGIEVTCEEHDFWNDNYRKILDETKKIYEDDNKAKQELFEIEQAERQSKLLEEEQQKQENDSFWSSCLIGLFAIGMVIFLVYCLFTEKFWLFVLVFGILGFIILPLVSFIIMLFKS